MPMNGQNGTTSSDTLNGWKDIASYLNRSVRAVQRWERELGLPVHRIKAAEGQTVYGLCTEIDEWRRSRDLPKIAPEDVEDSMDPDPRAASKNESGEGLPAAPVSEGALSVRRWVLIVFAAVSLVAAGAALGAFFVGGLVGPVQLVQAAGTSVVAYDSLGRVVWTKNLGRQVSRADGLTGRGDTWAMFVDLDGNGETETVIPLRFAAGGKPSRESDQLVAFDAHGKVLWTLKPDVRLRCGPDVFDAPWRIYAVRASTAPGQSQRLWVAYNHSTWWPGIVMEVAGNGQAHMKMLHTGWISDLVQWETPSGDFLAVAGYNNELVRPSVSLVDMDAKASMSPYTDPRFSCSNAPTAQPRHVYLFPTLDTGIAANAHASDLAALGTSLIVHVSNDHGRAVAEIAPSLKVADFSMTDSYWAIHRARELDGFLKHPAETCPERTRPQPIEEWTMATSWSTSSLLPTVRQSPQDR